MAPLAHCSCCAAGDRSDPCHGGDLVSRLNALVWLQTLYACDLSKMKPQTVEGLPDIALNEIAIKVGKKIEPYNAVYKGK